MAQAIFSLSSPHQTRNPDNIAALRNEWMAATNVWVSLPLNAPKQRRLHSYLAAIEARMRTTEAQFGMGR
jgi:hypothetical protein